MNRRQYIIEVVNKIVRNAQTAEIVVDTLIEEGVLHLGYGDKDVDAITEKFATTFGNTKTSRYDRFAAHRLALKYSPQAVIGVIELLGGLGAERYVPVVNNVAQLEEKMPSVLAFLRKQGKNEVIDV